MSPGACTHSRSLWQGLRDTLPQGQGTPLARSARKEVAPADMQARAVAGVQWTSTFSRCVGASRIRLLDKQGNLIVREVPDWPPALLCCIILPFLDSISKKQIATMPFTGKF